MDPPVRCRACQGGPGVFPEADSGPICPWREAINPRPGETNQATHCKGPRGTPGGVGKPPQGVRLSTNGHARVWAGNREKQGRRPRGPGNAARHTPSPRMSSPDPTYPPRAKEPTAPRPRRRPHDQRVTFRPLHANPRPKSLPERASNWIWNALRML